MSEQTAEQPYVDLAHRVPDEEWAAIVRRAQEIREAETTNKTGGASSPAGKIIDLRGRSDKHSGVSGIPTQLLVLHSAECPLRGGYALSLTEWAITTAVIASWQRFVDPFHRVYMIDDNYAAWHASEANPMSIGWEQAGYARFSRAEWTTPDGMLQMESLAYDMAQVAKRDGIPAVWLTTDEVTAVTTYGNRTIKGFCLHRQIDPETRTDPGDGYPYDLLMAKIKGYMGSAATAPQSTSTPPKEFLMALTDQQQEELYKLVKEGRDAAVSARQGVWYGGESQGKNFKYGILPIVVESQRRDSENAAIIKNLISALTKVAAGEKFDEAKLLAGVKDSAKAGTLEGLENGAVDVKVTVAGGTDGQV